MFWGLRRQSLGRRAQQSCGGRNWRWAWREGWGASRLLGLGTPRGDSPPAVHGLLTITRGVLVEEEEMGWRRAASPAAETPALFPWTSTAVQDPGREGARRGGCLRA